MNGRLYDPALGRMLSADNYVQDPLSTQSFNRYSYVWNNPLTYNDPDGEWAHIAVGAVVGGVVNLGVKLFTNRIGSFRDGLAAFGIGAVAGAVTAATGGAAAVYASTGSFAGAFSASAVTAASTGISGGMVAGAAGSALGGPVLGMGNAAYFGDPYSFKDWAVGVGVGTFMGGVSGGLVARFQNKPVWNGVDKSGSWFPNYGKKQWTLTEHAGWKLKSVYADRGYLEFPDFIDPSGGFHAGGKYNFGPEGVSAGTRTSTKLLNQFNSAESLIQGAGNLTKVKAGMQGFVKGDGPSIFKAVTNGGTLSPKGYYTMPNGTVISKYFSSTSGDFTIFINQGSNAFKIRITP